MVRKPKKPESEPKIVTVEEFASKLELETLVKGCGEIAISSINVSRPGLQLCGFYKHFASDRVQVIGNAEHEYLRCLKADERAQKIEDLFKCELPCLIVSRGLEVPECIVKAAEKYGTPLYRSQAITTVLIHDLMLYLNDLLAPTTVIHGELLDVSGVGVLITGEAGIGKSETALELITRGHRLVADDTVHVKNRSDLLVGTCPAKIQYFMEVRGLGIINVKTMFGPGSIRPEKTVDLVAHLVHWDEKREYDRLGDERTTATILGIEKPKHIIPVSPGRNIPVIIETAARKYRLEQLGYSALDELLNASFNNKQ